MTPEQHRLVESIFDAVADLPVQQRPDAVHARAGGDAAVAAEVLRLLDFDCRTVAPLDRPPPGLAAAIESQSLSQALPDQIGPFRILSVVASGGMGTVYRAQQQQPARVVALKVLREALGGLSMLRRFELEAETLGRLAHPGIAQIYQAGTFTDPAGLRRPYFAMEFIDGEPLDQWAHRTRPSPPAVLRLMAEVCDAVQHAHQKGVIHRDLKPANILVTADGRPKVVDFGVARSTEANRALTMATSPGQLVGTLEYMSPEQVAANPDAVDTRTDVYSLGVVLWQLLAGQSLSRATGGTRSLDEIIRTIKEVDAPRLGAVNPALRGDTEVIVAKAMEKDLARRYPSAAELAADIRRSLNSEPISARPASTIYQVSRFARRNRGLVAGVAAAFIAVVAGSVVSVALAVQASAARAVAETQRTEAERRRQEADAQRAEAEAQRTRALQEQARTAAVEGFLLEDMISAVSPDRLGPDARIVDVARLARASVATRFAGQPELQAEVRGKLGRMFRSLGEADTAIQEFLTADRLLTPLLPESPESEADKARYRTAARLVRSLAAAYAGSGQHELALESVDRTLRLLALAGSPAPAETASALLARAEALQVLGRREPARETLRQAFDLLPSIPADQATPVHISLLATRGAIEVAERNWKAAEPAFRAMLDLAQADPDTYAESCAIALSNLGNVLNNTGRAAEAVAYAGRAMELVGSRLGPLHIAQVSVPLTFATAYLAVEQFELAEPLALRAHDAALRVFGPDRFEHERTVVLLRDLYTAWTRSDPGRRAELERWHLAALFSRARLAGVRDFTSLEVAVDRYLSEVQNAQPGRAKADFTPDLLALADQHTPPGHPRRARVLANIGRLAVAAGMLKTGERLLTAVEPAIADAQNPAEERSIVYPALTMLAEARGDTEAAARYRRLRQGPPPSQPAAPPGQTTAPASETAPPPASR